jgi:hypothetical protein
MSHSLSCTRSKGYRLVILCKRVGTSQHLKVEGILRGIYVQKKTTKYNPISTAKQGDSACLMSAAATPSPAPVRALVPAHATAAERRRDGFGMALRARCKIV